MSTLLHCLDDVDDASFVSELDASSSSSSSSVTRKQLLRRAASIAKLFPGTMSTAVILFDSNSLRVIETLVACWLARVEPLLVSWGLSPGALATMITEQLQWSSPMVLCCDEALKARAESIGCGRVIMHASVCADADDSTMDAFIEEALARVDDSGIALVLHTSGTTASPTCVRLTHRNLIANQRCCDRALSEISESQHSLLTLPLFHGFGLETQFFRHVFHGSGDSCSILVDHSLSSSSCCSNKLWSGTQLVHIASRDPRIDTLYCVPLVFVDVARAIFRLPTTNIKNIFVGGAPLNDEAKLLATRLFVEKRIATIGLLGMTELAGSVMFSRAGHDPNVMFLAPAFVGCARFVGPDDGDKELQFSVADCDALCAAAAAGTTVERLHFATRDLYRRSCDGGCLHVGRVDDLFKLASGKSVNPSVIESVCSRFFSPHTPLVVGQSDWPFFVVVVEQAQQHDLSASSSIEVTAALQDELTKIGAHCTIHDRDQIVVLPHSVRFEKTPKGSVNRRSVTRLAMPHIRRQLPALFCGAPLATRRMRAGTLRECVRCSLRTIVSGGKTAAESSGGGGGGGGVASHFADNSIALALLVAKLKRDLVRCGDEEDELGDDADSVVAVHLESLSVVGLLVTFQRAVAARCCSDKEVVDRVCAVLVRDRAVAAPSSSSPVSSPASFVLDHHRSIAFIRDALVPVMPSHVKRRFEESLKLLDGKHPPAPDARWKPFIEDLASSFLVVVPFQSLSMVVRPQIERSLPTFDAMCRDVMEHRIGGQCYVLNVFFGALLRSLGFDSYFGRCTIHVVEDCHIGVFLRNVTQPKQVCQIEVASGYLMPVLMTLSGDEASSSSPSPPVREYRHGSLRILLSRRRDSDGRFSLWHNDEDNLFWTTTAEEKPVFSCSSQACSLQTEAYLSYSKLRVSRAIVESEEGAECCWTRSLYLKANVVGSRLESCVALSDGIQRSVTPEEMHELLAKHFGELDEFSSKIV